MNVLDAINAHVMWKLRLRKYVAGTSEESLDSAVVGTDHQCMLGKWIYSEGQAFSHLPEFKQMVEEHAQFHRCAAEIIDLVDEGESKEADGVLRGRYNRLSHDISGILTKLGRSLAA